MTQISAVRQVLLDPVGVLCELGVGSWAVGVGAPVPPRCDAEHLPARSAGVQTHQRASRVSLKYHNVRH